MAVNIGSSGAGAIFVGDRPVSTVYVGDTKVWPPEIVVVPVETFDAEAHTISYSGSVTELGVETAAEAVFFSEATASAVGAVTPVPYSVTGTVSAKSTTAGWISGYTGIYGRAFSFSDGRVEVTGEIRGETDVATTASGWIDIPAWVEAVDCVVVGGGAAGDAYGSNAFLTGGSGGGSGKWSQGQFILRNLFAAEGFNRNDYKVQYRYTPGAGGTAVAGGKGNAGSDSIFELRAVQIYGGSNVKALIAPVVGKGGVQSGGSGGAGGFTPSAGAGQAVIPQSIQLDGNTYEYVGGGSVSGNPPAAQGLFPGGGGSGGMASGGVGGLGGKGKVWWRLHSESTISQTAFVTPGPSGVYQWVSIPTSTVEIDFAIIGGGGGGAAGGFLGGGLGGVGGSWATSGSAEGLSLEKLYKDSGITASAVQELRFGYQVGGGGRGAPADSSSPGDGADSKACIQAKVGGVWNNLKLPGGVFEKVAAGGKGRFTGYGGGDANAGDTSNGKDQRIRVLGRSFLYRGGSGGAAPLPPPIGSPGNAGTSPGGGGGGGGQNLAGFDGADGASGAVYLVYGAVEPVNKVQVFECLGTIDDNTTSFSARHLDPAIFDHTIVKGYPNSLLPAGLIPLLPSRPGDTNLSVSVNSGVQQVMKLINSYGDDSPFVLIGASQGAQIMGTVWSTYIRNDPKLKARCKGVYLMGNPIREAGKAFPAIGTANPMPPGNGIATPDLRLSGTDSSIVHEFAKVGDPVCCNTSTAVEAAYGTMWSMTTAIDVLLLGVNFFGVWDMLMGMNADHNCYSYNPDGSPVDMTNPFRPMGGTKPCWKIIIDHLNQTVGPATMYRGTFMPDGTFQREVREYSQAEYEIESAVDAVVEIL